MNSLNCLHCGRIVERHDYLQINIEATRGPRVNADRGPEMMQTFSPYPTTTQAILCTECLWQPELEPILRLISAPLAEVSMHAGGRCVVLCRGRKPFVLLPWLRRRIKFWPAVDFNKCPLCGKAAVCWPAPQAPTRYSEEAEKLAAGGIPGYARTRRPLRPAAAGALDGGEDE